MHLFCIKTYRICKNISYINAALTRGINKSAILFCIILNKSVFYDWLPAEKWQNQWANENLEA